MSARLACAMARGLRRPNANKFLCRGDGDVRRDRRESALVAGPRAAHSSRRKVMAMYDSNLDNIWPVEIKFVEDETHTHATARAQLRGGETIAATGDAYRNPTDARQPMIGEEIAAARALISLGSELLHTASMQIEQVTHRPVHLER